MSARSRGARFTHAALALCALTVALALGSVLLRSAGPKTGARDRADREVEHSSASRDGERIESSSASFLQDLDAAVTRRRAHGRADADEIHAGWRESASLPGLTGDVLRAYRAQGSCELVSSGYLDIKGDVWGALVRDRAGWVDIVTITASADDGCATAGVVRLVPEDIPERATR